MQMCLRPSLNESETLSTHRAKLTEVRPIRNQKKNKYTFSLPTHTGQRLCILCNKMEMFLIQLCNAVISFCMFIRHFPRVILIVPIHKENDLCIAWHNQDYVPIRSGIYLYYLIFI